MFKRLIIIAVLFFSIVLSLNIISYAETLFYIDSFDQADTNRDGYVSEDEAGKAGLLNSDNFIDADSDADGFLSLREAKGANLQLPKTEEEKPVAQKEETEPQSKLAQKEQIEELAEIPPEIKKEQEKLGIATQPSPAVKPTPRIPSRSANAPARSIQGQRRPFPRGSSVGAPGNAMPPQMGGRSPRRPPSFTGKRIPKPQTSTTPNTAQPQSPQ